MPRAPLEELPARRLDLPRRLALGAGRAEGAGHHRRRRLLEKVPCRLPAVLGRAADRGDRAAHHRGLQGIRHHLGHDPRRTGQHHQGPEHGGLPGGILVPTRRERRLHCADRRADQRRPDGGLRHRHAPPGGGALMSGRRQRLIKSWLIHAAALLLTVLILAPVIWMGLMSVSSTNDLTAVPLRWIPAEWDFSRYVKLLTITENTTGAAFTASLRNSMVVAGLGAILALVVGIPAAWSVSRMARRFSWMLRVSVATYMRPPVALVVPMYFALSGMGALNSVFSLALIYLSILAPFTAWLLKSNFDNVPFEIEQAAMMDGANLMQIMRNVTLPLAAPGLTTAGLFAFLLAWDEFFYCLLLT